MGSKYFILSVPVMTVWGLLAFSLAGATAFFHSSAGNTKLTECQRPKSHRSTRIFQNQVQEDKNQQNKLLEGPKRIPSAIRVVNQALSAIFVFGDIFGQSGGKPTPDLEHVSVKEDTLSSEEKNSESKFKETRDFGKLKEFDSSNLSQSQVVDAEQNMVQKQRRFPIPFIGKPLDKESRSQQVFLNAQITSSVQVNDSSRLHTYMSQPVEKYSALDTSLISKLNDSVFRLSLPLDQILNIGILPEIDAGVVVDSDKRCVTIKSEKCQIWIFPEGERQKRQLLPKESFSTSFLLELKWEDLQSSSGNDPGRFVRFRELLGGTLPHDEDRQEIGVIDGTLLVSASFDAASFTIIPRRILQKAGSVVLDALLAYLFPKFLDLLVDDYHSFMTEERREQNP